MRPYSRVLVLAICFALLVCIGAILVASDDETVRLMSLIALGGWSLFAETFEKQSRDWR